MRSWLQSLSVARQLIVLALGVVALAALLVALWLWLRTPYEPLFTSLRASDAATVVADLDKRKVPYRLADQGGTVLVPADRVDATRLALMNGDMALKGTVGFELFNKSDMGLTDFAQRINYQRALQGELERTIMSLDSVDEARVHLSLGEDRVFREDRVPPKASVTVRMRASARLAPTAAAGIQRLVAAAVPQLAAQDVVILDEMGQVVASGAPSLGGDAETRAIGDFYAARIRDALKRAFDALDVDVAVDPAVADAEAANGWTATARTFPLEITLEPRTALDDDRRHAIRQVAAQAIGFDANLGDIIRFGTLGADGGAGASDAIRSPIGAPPAAAPVDAPIAPRTDAAWLPFALLLLAGGALAVLLVRGRGRALAPARRAALAARLAELIDREERDAARA